MKRTKIKDILQSKPDGRNVLLQGWIRSNRGSKGVSFLVMNDGSTILTAQIVADDAFREKFAAENPGVDYDEFLGKIKIGACIRVEGRVIPSAGAGQDLEVAADKIEIYGEADPATYPLQKNKASLEYLREISHLRVRTNTFSAIFRIRNSAAFAIHKFFFDRGFFYAHTPILTGSDAEGAGEMFQVTTLDMDHLPKTDEGAINYDQDFFGKPVHLTVSGQLNGELLAMGLGEIYTFGPTFRAENSNTARHLAEFWMIEPEMAFYEAEDNQKIAEEFVQYVIRFVMDHCNDDLKFLAKRLEDEESQKPVAERSPMPLLEKLDFVVNNKFEKITYTEAIDILLDSTPYKKKKFQYDVAWGVDLQSEHERFLVEKHFKKPVIVIDYPKDIKAFYMKQNADGKTVRAMDVLFPGIGEIIGGSQREERYDVLLGRINELKLIEKDYWWYLDTRKFGTAPHSGFGLGFERLLLFLTGMGNIRDVIPFPRTPRNAEF